MGDGFSMVYEPNLATGLLCTHNIITRALDVSIDKSLNAGEFDETSKTGFIYYIQSLKTVITAHHHLETQQVFPYFRDKIPDLPVVKLNQEHGKIGMLLNEVEEILPDSNNDLNKSSLKQLNTALIGINDIWHPHIDVEEQYFTAERMDDLLDKDEMMDLIKEYREFSLERYLPDYLVIPFQFYNLPPDERKIWLQELPEKLNKNLISVEWKDKWMPMANFLYPDFE